MTISLTIDERQIGPGHSPYIIAEMSANHGGDFAKAIATIDAAKLAGADAIKLQTYRPDTITLKAETEEFMIRGGLWDGRTLWDLYQEAHTPWAWHAPLFEHAQRQGITIFSSPFDPTAVDLLEDLNAPAYKVASFEIVDLPLIRYIASTGKPLIMSTGLSNLDEIGEAVATARDAGCRELALLHCVSGYPAPAEDYHLYTIPDLSQRFGTVVGLSDHTLGSATAIAAVALGAGLVEKHFTLDRSAGGPDDSFSLEPHELKALCADCATAWTALGRPDYSIKGSETGNIKFRRSLYFVKDLEQGDVITESDIRSVRPGYGLPPREFQSIIGRKLVVPVKANTPVTWAAIGSDNA